MDIGKKGMKICFEAVTQAAVTGAGVSTSCKRWI